MQRVRDSKESQYNTDDKNNPSPLQTIRNDTSYQVNHLKYYDCATPDQLSALAELVSEGDRLLASNDAAGVQRIQGSFELRKDPGKPGFLLLSFKEDQQRVLRLSIDKYGDRIEPSVTASSWAKEGVLDVESEDT